MSDRGHKKSGPISVEGCTHFARNWRRQLRFIVGDIQGNAGWHFREIADWSAFFGGSLFSPSRPVTEHSSD
jgi:hypothetical protein